MPSSPSGTAWRRGTVLAGAASTQLRACLACPPPASSHMRKPTKNEAGGSGGHLSLRCSLHRRHKFPGPAASPGPHPGPQTPSSGDLPTLLSTSILDSLSPYCVPPTALREGDTDMGRSALWPREARTPGAGTGVDQQTKGPHKQSAAQWALGGGQGLQEASWGGDGGPRDGNSIGEASEVG